MPNIVVTPKKIKEKRQPRSGDFYVRNDGTKEEFYILTFLVSTSIYSVKFSYFLIDISTGERWNQPMPLEKLLRLIERDSSLKHIGNVKLTIEPIEE